MLDPPRLTVLRCRPVLLLRLWLVFERLPPLELFLVPAKAADAPPVSKDNARRLERIVFMPYQWQPKRKNRTKSLESKLD